MNNHKEKTGLCLKVAIVEMRSYLSTQFNKKIAKKINLVRGSRIPLIFYVKFLTEGRCGNGKKETEKFGGYIKSYKD